MPSDTNSVLEVRNELRRAGVSDVDASTRRRAEYSSDAGNYRVVPRTVVFPHSADDVEAALSVCRRLGLPLTCRGAGTSTAGNSVSSGVVLDFSRHMNRVLAVDPDSSSAFVQPGAVLDHVTAAAAPHGLRFGPDPSTHSRASIGGTLGNNACGSRVLAYGRSCDNVKSLDVITGTGLRFTATTGSQSAPASLQAQLKKLVTEHESVIRQEFGRFGRQVSGYAMEHLLPENDFALCRFLSGSEGTLAVTLEAKVRLVKPPGAVALLVLGYEDMAAAADAAVGLLPYTDEHNIHACEGMDARMVEVMRKQVGPASVPDLPRGGGWLFVETAGDRGEEAVAHASALVGNGDALDSAVLRGADAAELWRIREAGVGLAGHTPGGQPAWPGWEDSAVPPENLGKYLRELRALMKEHRLDGLMYGHFADGCIHVRIDFPFQNGSRVFRSFVTAAAKLVTRYGGSLSGEHGDGRARGELLGTMYSPTALSLFSAVKNIFDPADALNPGVITSPHPLDADLRVPAARSITRGLAFSYPDDGGDLTRAVHRCTGVGQCRAENHLAGKVMCPSYAATRDEKDVTRARSRVLQELANGQLVDGWRSDELMESLDLCLACKGCRRDCPTGIDMATYKAEVLYQRYRNRLRPPSHYSLGWLPRLARGAAFIPGVVNASMKSQIAPIAKRLAGVDGRREIPSFASQTFRAWFADRPPRSEGDPVMLWVDTWNNFFTPEVGQAAVRVLEAAGHQVQIPEPTVCCGLTWISTGQLAGAKRQLRRSFAALEATLTAGTPIVGLEPSCTAVFRADAPELLPDDERAHKANDAFRTLAEQLEADHWPVPDLSDVHAIAQPHCHHHSVLGWDSDRRLLQAGGADVKEIGGCCGLAGNFGTERGHYDVSVAVAETTLLPALRDQPRASVLADGFSCRTQIQQLSGRLPARRSGQHLAMLLAQRLPSGDGARSQPAVGKERP